MSALPSSTRAVPALALACVFAGGILLRHAGMHVWIPAGLLGLACALVLSALIQARRRLVTLLPLALYAAILSGTLLSGYIRLDLSLRVHPNDVRKLHATGPREITLEGRITSEPVWRNERLRFPMDAVLVEANGQTHPVRGRVQIVADRDTRDGFFAGQSVRVHGLIASPAPRRNPADFDYRAFLERQEIHSIIRAGPDGVETRPGSITARDGALRAVRAWIRRSIETHIESPASRTIVQALTLGDRSGLSPEERERFARSGLMHLLAVSGLHVMLVGMVVYRLLRPAMMRLCLSRRWVEVSRASLTIGLLVSYMMVTGNTPSVVRAVLMASVFIVGATLERRSHPLNTIGIAALVLLCFRPHDLFQVGFQLSFSAVISIILFAPAIPSGASGSKMHPLLRYVLQSVGVSLAATIGTMPTLLFHFGRTSFAGLLLNLGAIPTTAALLTSSLAMIATAEIPHVGAAFGSSANFLANLLIKTATLGDSWFRWALVDMYVRDAFLLVAIGGIVAIPSIWSLRRVRWKYLASLLSLAGVSYALWLSGPKSDALEVLFFDVGQADAALVTFPNGKTMLVDVGRRDFAFDAGERVILPHLRRFGIRRIDAAVISHPHSDHIGGLPSILRGVPVSRVLDNGDDYDSSVFRESLHLIDSLHITRQMLSAGDSILLDPRVRVLVLGPDASVGSGVNDRSVVVQIIYGSHRILLTGDAEHSAEAALLQGFAGILPSDVIKVGHHGSSTSSGDAFVPFVAGRDRSTHAVVSVGMVNRYRHPNTDVIERWRTNGSSVHKTSLHGAAWFRTDGKTLRLIQWNR